MNPIWPPGTNYDSFFYVVFDLDGTLADDSHRLHFIEGPTRNDDAWVNYYRACVNDKPIDSLCRLFRHLANPLVDRPAVVEIWTGRSEIVRNETNAWLKANRLHTLRLMMRPDGIYESNEELKAEWLQAAPRKPDLVIDDNLKVVEWWRSQGVFALAAGTASF